MMMQVKYAEPSVYERAAQHSFIEHVAKVFTAAGCNVVQCGVLHNQGGWLSIQGATDEAEVENVVNAAGAKFIGVIFSTDEHAVVKFKIRERSEGI